MHEYWLQFFTAALGVYGKGQAAEKAADEACAIYDKRVSDARRAASDAHASRVNLLNRLNELVFDSLPSVAPGMSVEQIRITIGGNFDSVMASLASLFAAGRIYQRASSPPSYYRKAV